MRLALIKRTIEAMVDMNLDSAGRMTEIAEELAEKFPRSDEVLVARYSALISDLMVIAAQRQQEKGYIPLGAQKSPDLATWSLIAYTDPVSQAAAN